jgi:hypothetical protein
MSASPPFRVWPTASGKLPDDALRAVSRARSAPQKERLEWALHEDERYAIALANTVWLREGQSIHQNEIAAVLAVRGILAARREGNCWNPILDGVARGPNPGLGDMKFAATRLGVDPAEVAVTPLSRLLEPLARWLDEQADAARVMDLLEFRAPDVLQLVARRAPLNPELTSRLVERDAQLADGILVNVRLDRASAETLFEWAFRSVTNPKARRIETYARTVARIDEMGHRPIRRDEIEFLLSFAEDHSNGTLSTGYPRWRAVDALIRLRRHLRTSDVHRVLSQAVVWGGFIDGLIEAPACDVEAAREALRVSRSGQLREYVARVPEWRRDPEIRAALLRSSKIEVLAPLMDETISDEEFRRLYRKLLRQRGEYAALTFLEKSPVAGARLTPADLEPLLTSSKPETRLRAIALLSAVRKPT